MLCQSNLVLSKRARWLLCNGQGLSLRPKTRPGLERRLSCKCCVAAAHPPQLSSMAPGHSHNYTDLCPSPAESLAVSAAVVLAAFALGWWLGKSQLIEVNSLSSAWRIFASKLNMGPQGASQNYEESYSSIIPRPPGAPLRYESFIGEEYGSTPWEEKDWFDPTLTEMLTTTARIENVEKIKILSDPMEAQILATFRRGKRKDEYRLADYLKNRMLRKQNYDWDTRSYVKEDKPVGDK